MVRLVGMLIRGSLSKYYLVRSGGACGRGVGQNSRPEFACIESQSASPPDYSINYTVVHSRDEQGCCTLQIRVCGLWY